MLAQKASEAFALATLSVASAVGAAVERSMFLSPDKIPGGQQQGTTGNSEGSQATGEPPEVAGNTGGAAAADAGKVAKIGDDFGKLGEMVENPGMKADWANTTTHGKERMMQRGVTQDMMEVWMKDGKVLAQSGGNYIYITKEGAAIFNKSLYLLPHIQAQNMMMICGELL